MKTFKMLLHDNMLYEIFDKDLTTRYCKGIKNNRENIFDIFKKEFEIFKSELNIKWLLSLDNMELYEINVNIA